MTLSHLDLSCLNCTCDDYEDIPQIRMMLSESNNLQMSEEEIAASLVRLTEAGLAMAYAYDYEATKGKFIPTKYFGERNERRWAISFLVTQLGLDYLDKNWPSN